MQKVLMICFLFDRFVVCDGRRGRNDDVKFGVSNRMKRKAHTHTPFTVRLTINDLPDTVTFASLSRRSRSWHGQ